MAERIEEPEAEARGSDASPDAGAAAAIALALGRAPKGKLFDEDARTFFREQTDLIRIQKEHLHEQRELLTSRLRLGRWKDRVTLTLQALTVLVGLVAAGSIGIMAWTAHEDHGVTIAAFSVPPDLAQKGLTGQVLASQVLDRLADLQARTITARPASTYANDWGGDIKVEIPETGVSIGELNRWLREWLGHETRITGEVVRIASGISVTARAGAESGRRFDGSEADLDKLIQKAAEAVYDQTQPYRYAAYLQSSDRIGEAENAYARLARSGSAEDRPWALTGWAALLLTRGDLRGAADKARLAIEADPRLPVAYSELYTAEAGMSHSEAALGVVRKAQRELQGRAARNAPGMESLHSELGDYYDASLDLKRTLQLSSEGQTRYFPLQNFRALVMAEDHDVSGARALLATVDDPGGPSAVPKHNVALMCQAMLEDWQGMIQDGALQSAPVVARVALLVHAGHTREAQAFAASLPLDCDDCLTIRGSAAAAAGDWKTADQWFARAAQQAPSHPFASARWGEALLAKGDLDGAVEKLTEAHRRSPRYADPIELWGEALMKKGDLAGAVAKFAEADKYAPRWGRNHLRWGEALMLAGRYREARVQFEAANGMDLSKPDRAALNVFLDRTAKGPLHG